MYHVRVLVAIECSIARDLAGSKLDAQADLVSGLAASTDAVLAIRQATDALEQAETSERLRIVEADAAKAYWEIWRLVPVRFGQRDKYRVPDHWRTFGMRASPFTGSPRLAANPANALLNYLYAIRRRRRGSPRWPWVSIRVSACFTRSTEPRFAGLRCDGTGAPQVDAWVNKLLQERTFSIHDFAETNQRVCRVLPPLTQLLAETAPTYSVNEFPGSVEVNR